MAQNKPAVLVLWGNYFDEYIATAFVCELRAAGVRVRIVGLDGRLARGRYGMMLGTDLSLERVRALQQPVTHVVAPCSGAQWAALQDKPHAAEFMQRLTAGGAVFIAAGESEMAGATPPLPLPALRLWPPEMRAGEVARQLVREIAP